MSKQGKSAIKLGSAWRGVLFGAALAMATTGCSRDHIEAINLANEGDRSVKVNVEGAISKYEQAVNLDPTNHRIMWKLAKAYEKKEDWDKMAATLSRAVQQAPDFATYWYKRGFAMMQQARGGNPDRYKDAIEPLKKCIEKDANYAECYHELGDAYLWTDDVQSAVQNFQAAIEHDPTIGYFYTPLGETYINLKLYKEAEGVLSEGGRTIPPLEKNKSYIYNVYVLLSLVHQAKGNFSEMASVLEKANAVAGDKHPEIAFNLGSTYAVMAEKDASKKTKAVQLLTSFSSRVCRGGKRKKFRDQCETSQSLIQKLGGKVQ